MDAIQTGTQPAVKPLTISVDECRVRWQTAEPPLVIDARKASDWEASPVQIQHSLRLDPEQLPKEFAGPKGRFIMVYCH
jgi:hypothetical protein